MKLQRFGKTLVCIVLFVALFFAFYWLFGDDISKKRQLTELLKTQEQKVAELQKELDLIREEVARMQDPEYVELLAREQGLAYPGETVYEYISSEESKINQN